MKFFFDNNLSAHLAHGVRELSELMPGVDRVVHLTDCFEKNAPDLTWIGELSKEGPWYIISIDRFKKHHGAERAAICRAGHTVFVLDGPWSKHGFWMQTERFVRWWPQMVDYSSRVTGGAYRVPWQHARNTKFQAITF